MIIPQNNIKDLKYNMWYFGIKTIFMQFVELDDSIAFYKIYFNDTVLNWHSLVWKQLIKTVLQTISEAHFVLEMNKQFTLMSFINFSNSLWRS